MPLNEEKFLARRAELDADEEEEKTFEEQANGNDEVFKRDFYINEVLEHHARLPAACSARTRSPRPIRPPACRTSADCHLLST